MDDFRNPYLENWAARMADIVLDRTLLSREVMIIYNKISRDQYQDAFCEEEFRVKKPVMLKKNMDMEYVQELGDILSEEGEIPWIVNLTITDLPRIPKMDDQILIDGIKYSISAVKPMNRDLDSLISLFIYPERAHYVDDFNIECKFYYEEKLIENLSDYVGKNVVADIIYGGNPVQMDIDGSWTKFLSSFKFSPEIGQVLKFKDAKDKIIEYDLRL